MPDVLKILFLAIFFLSSPIAVCCVYVFGCDRPLCAVANSYAFSAAMICLYTYPFLTSATWSEKIHAATMNWVVWLSVFTELIFQIPHNLFVRQLHDAKGTPVEWPFYSYGLSDSRWSNYHGGSGLSPEVWLINLNDAAFGLLVVVLYFVHESSKRKSPTAAWRSKILLALVILFRDATLWRETVEYMWDHHRKHYPHSTDLAEYRGHAIACLWTVNIVWLVAPCVTVAWVLNVVSEGGPAEKSKKVKAI